MKATDVKRNKIFIREKKRGRARAKASVPHSILRKIIMKQMWPVAVFTSYSEDDVYHHEFSFKRTKRTQTEYFISHIIDTRKYCQCQSLPHYKMSECVCANMSVLTSILWCAFTAISEALSWKYSRKNRRIKRSICVRCKGMKRLNIKTWKITSCHSQLWN